MSKRFIVIGGSIVLLLGMLNLYFYARAIMVNDKLKKVMANRDRDILQRVDEERVKVSQDLNEKYRADMVSFGAMTKRFEMEKKKAQEMEKRLGATKIQKK